MQLCDPQQLHDHPSIPIVKAMLFDHVSFIPNPQTCDRRTSEKVIRGVFFNTNPPRGVGITSVLSEFEKSTRYFPLRQEFLPV